MTENIRLSTGLMFMIGLIHLGIGVYYIDDGEDIRTGIVLLILGFLLIGFGIWTFYNVLIPTILTAVIYLGLIIYLKVYAPEYLFTKGTNMYFGIVIFSITGAIKDAFSLKKGVGLNELEYIGEPVQVLPRRPKNYLEMRVERTKIGKYLLSLHGSKVLQIILTPIVIIFVLVISGFVLFTIGMVIYYLFQ